MKYKTVVRILITIIIVSINIFSWNLAANAVTLNPDQEDRLIAYNQPAIVKTLATFCSEFTFGESELNDQIDIEITEQSYTFCNYKVGNGGIVNSEGVVATSAQVVTFDEDEKLQKALLIDDIVNVFVEIVSADTLDQEGIETTDEEKEILIEQILSDDELLAESASRMNEFFETERLVMGEETIQNFVQRNGKSFEFGDNNELINIDDHFQAEVLVIDYEITDAEGQLAPTSSAIALIKIDSEVTFPTIVVGNSDTLLESSQLIQLSYGIEDTQQSTSIVTSDELTLDRGIVNSIDQGEENTFKTISTDLEFSNDDNGAIIFDIQGNAVGIANYFEVDSSENTSQSIVSDINVLLNLAEENDIQISQSSLDVTWISALDLFWNSKFTDSIEEFENVLDIYPEHPIVSEYISRAQIGIDNGEEILTLEEEIYKYIPEEQFPIVVGGVVGSIIFLLLLIIVLRVFRKKPKKMPPMPKNETTKKVEASEQKSEQKQEKEETKKVESATPIVDVPVQDRRMTDKYKITDDEVQPQEHIDDHPKQKEPEHIQEMKTPEVLEINEAPEKPVETVHNHNQESKPVVLNSDTSKSVDDNDTNQNYEKIQKSKVTSQSKKDSIQKLNTTMKSGGKIESSNQTIQKDNPRSEKSQDNQNQPDQSKPKNIESITSKQKTIKSTESQVDQKPKENIVEELVQEADISDQVQSTKLESLKQDSKVEPIKSSDDQKDSTPQLDPVVTVEQEQSPKIQDKQPTPKNNILDNSKKVERTESPVVEADHIDTLPDFLQPIDLDQEPAVAENKEIVEDKSDSPKQIQSDSVVSEKKEEKVVPPNPFPKEQQSTKSDSKQNVQPKVQPKPSVQKPEIKKPETTKSDANELPDWLSPV